MNKIKNLEFSYFGGFKQMPRLPMLRDAPVYITLEQINLIYNKLGGRIFQNYWKMYAWESNRGRFDLET